MVFLDLLRDQRVVAVLRGEDALQVRHAAETLIEAGVRIIELTLTVPGVLDVMRDLSDSPATIGIGTLARPEDAERAVSAGAQFLVSPGVSTPLLQTMRDSGVPALPGVQSPSEVMQAREAGFQMLKLFPASLVGPTYIRDMKGPFPDLEFVPSGGIGITDVADWLAAGAVAVGLGSLARSGDIAAENWAGIREQALAAMRAVGRVDA